MLDVREYGEYERYGKYGKMCASLTNRDVLRQLSQRPLAQLERPAAPLVQPLSQLDQLLPAQLERPPVQLVQQPINNDV